MEYREQLNKEIDGLEKRVEELNSMTAGVVAEIDRLKNELAEYRKKYNHSLTVLAAIANRTGANDKAKYRDEWTEAKAFNDCKIAARRCLKYLGEEEKITKNNTYY